MSELSMWLEEKRQLIQAHNRDREILIRENRRLRNALNPKTEKIEESLRKYENDMLNLQISNTNLQNLISKTNIELSSTLKQLEESEEEREQQEKLFYEKENEYLQIINELRSQLSNMSSQYNALAVESEEKEKEFTGKLQAQYQQFQNYLVQQNMNQQGPGQQERKDSVGNNNSNSDYTNTSYDVSSTSRQQQVPSSSSSSSSITGFGQSLGSLTSSNQQQSNYTDTKRDQGQTPPNTAKMPSYMSGTTVKGSTGVSDSNEDEFVISSSRKSTWR